MCFISWVEFTQEIGEGEESFLTTRRIHLERSRERKRFFFLTDRDVYSEKGEERLRDVRKCDLVGHEAIRLFHDIPLYAGVNHQNAEFWNGKNFPPEIAQCLKSPQTLIDTWGRMLKDRAISPDTAFNLFFSMRNAPESWKDLADFFLDILARNAECSFRVLSCPDWFPVGEAQKNRLIEGVLKELHYAERTLRDSPDPRNQFNKDQIAGLVEGISKNPFYAESALCDPLNKFGWLDEHERDELVGGVLNDWRRSIHVLSFFSERLSKAQRKRLRDSIIR